ncbi:hypothetical protein TNCV_2434361 [Trichonephila clavipes]|nr:hypothetical protein TNCV_2434361 [Trichonephila clavipes]
MHPLNSRKNDIPIPLKAEATIIQDVNSGTSDYNSGSSSAVVLSTTYVLFRTDHVIIFSIDCRLTGGIVLAQSANLAGRKNPN